jgi:predicted N-acyltransferase
MAVSLRTRTVNGLRDVAPAAWNSLSVEGYPYLRHEFLAALEQQACLGHTVGWFPCHLLCEDGDGHLVGALPMYLKTNSFGEFVFDWAWAQAHERAGRDYYPKLVVASPFTPATGPRLLVATGADRNTVVPALIGAALGWAEESRVSSLHWLFGTDIELGAFPGLLPRLGCQFHWQNPGYRDFEDVLQNLTSKRRKEIRRERRQIATAGVTLERLRGQDAEDCTWELVHRLYRLTFAKHGNYAALSLGFFRQLARSMGDRILLVLARREGREVAAGLFFIGSDTLYGRHWGTFEEIPALHFEVCYYQGIEYCIEQCLQRFEPGAQGEHKLSRGFDPCPTWSYHWIADLQLRQAIMSFLRREAADVAAYMRALRTHSAYHTATAC